MQEQIASKKDYKEYTGNNVYEEALLRLDYIYKMYDHLVVAFSGGKDSLVALNLVKEYYDKNGITKKVNVVFRDEELIPDDVIEFVQKYQNEPWVNMLYFATQLESEKFILGKKYKYIQWDKNRPHIRPKPVNSIDLGDVVDQYTMDSELTKYFDGKIAVINGIRAEESLVRLSSVTSKRGREDAYIAKTKDPRVSFCKIIYDWSEDDIFLYFYRNNITYCKIYDYQNVNGDSYRVSTPIHAESSKKFNKIRTLYPNFYRQIIAVFPEMKLQERYWKDFDNGNVRDRVEGQPVEKITYRKIFAYIENNILDEKLKEEAKKKLVMALNNHKSQGGFPPEYVYKKFLNGGYKRRLSPNGKRTPFKIEDL